MLHCNGDDGTTTIIDSATSKAVTASGDTQLDTTQQKFGTASVLFDGYDDHLSLASHEDWHFGTGAFTVEFWFCLRGTRFIDIFYSHGGSNMPKGEGGAIGVSNYKIGYGSSGGGIVGTTTLATYTWYHCALVGDGGPDGARTIKLYLNGIQEGDTYVCDYDFVQTEIWLGANQHSTVIECLNGWIDEFRISKGIARWTGNFTPPICEYEAPTPTPIGASN